MRKKLKPKRAKLVTNGGFYKIIDIKQVDFKINIPFSTKIQLNSPELYGIPVKICGFSVFELEKVGKKMAIYKQIDAILED